MSPRRERDYRAEYQARLAKAAREGRTGQSRYGKAAREVAARARARALSHKPRERELRAGKAGRAKIREVNTSSPTYLAQVLRQAARQGKNVTIYTRWQTTDGGYVTHIIGGDQPEQRGANRASDRPAGKVTVLIGTAYALGGNGGIPAKRVVDQMANYDDVFDYLGDYYDSEESYLEAHSHVTGGAT